MKKFTSLSLSRYLAELSGRKPVPGGGSVSAFVACLGMGLAEMVAGIGLKKVPKEAQAPVRRAARLLAKTRKDALQIVDLDPRVYLAALKSYQEAKKIKDPERKEHLIEEALENSFRLQADLALLVMMAKKAAHPLAGVIRGSIVNDLAISLKLLDAAFFGAYETAHINGVYLRNPQRKARAEEALAELKRQFESLQEPIHAAGS